MDSHWAARAVVSHTHRLSTERRIEWAAGVDADHGLEAWEVYEKTYAHAADRLMEAKVRAQVQLLQALGPLGRHLLIRWARSLTHDG